VARSGAPSRPTPQTGGRRSRSTFVESSCTLAGCHAGTRPCHDPRRPALPPARPGSHDGGVQLDVANPVTRRTVLDTLEPTIRCCAAPSAATTAGHDGRSSGSSPASRTCPTSRPTTRSPGSPQALSPRPVHVRHRRLTAPCHGEATHPEHPGTVASPISSRAGTASRCARGPPPTAAAPAGRRRSG
jgi:hypothetical protein